MLFDYHLHTHYSFDAEYNLMAMAAAAQEHGVDEICFTDHYETDLGGGRYALPDWAAFAREYEAGSPFPVRTKSGVEVGLLLEEGQPAKVSQALSGYDFDFIIASLHLLPDGDPYEPEFFTGRSRSEGFAHYMRALIKVLPLFESFSIVGHIDYPAKGCPYHDKMLRYSDCPDELDTLFKFLAQSGHGLEINTSVFRCLGRDELDIDWLRRYRELGGEIVTIGSDAHMPEYVGYGFKPACAFLQKAGFKYVCTFAGLQPVFHKMEG